VLHGPDRWRKRALVASGLPGGTPPSSLMLHAFYAVTVNASTMPLGGPAGGEPVFDTNLDLNGRRDNVTEFTGSTAFPCVGHGLVSGTEFRG